MSLQTQFSDNSFKISYIEGISHSLAALSILEGLLCSYYFKDQSRRFIESNDIVREGLHRQKGIRQYLLLVLRGDNKKCSWKMSRESGRWLFVAETTN